MSTRVSLAELESARIPLQPVDAVAIVVEICHQFLTAELKGIPSAHVIRLTGDGRVVVEGPVDRLNSDHSPVARAALLLNDLLPAVDTPSTFRIPGGLRLMLARAAGTLDVPPFVSLEEFCASMRRFAAADLKAAASSIFQSWFTAQAAARLPAGLAEITISDVRRARRATGLSLKEVSGAAEIPVERLRTLEWGDLRKWSADARGRDELLRYARAVGLDEELVLSVAWPLISEQTVAGEIVPAAEIPPAETAIEPDVTGDLPAGWEMVRSGSQALLAPPAPARVRAMTFRRRLALAGVATILLLCTAISFVWEEEPPHVRSKARHAFEVVQIADPAPIVESVDQTPVFTHVVRAGATARPRRPAERQASNVHRPSRERSFFKKELLRIVIK
jgi:hypothetical protein